MIKLVVFDWNGTLLADTLACMDADNHLIKAFGGQPTGLKKYRETVIIPAIDFYVQHGCDREYFLNNMEKAGKIFHEFYEPRAERVRTRKNAKKLLQWLQAKNIESVILSNHTVQGISAQLKRLKIEKYFTELLANDSLDSSMKKRNKKEKLEILFKKSGLQKDEVIIVGDSPEENEMGKHIGIFTVSIKNGYYSTPRLRKSNPDYLIDNLSDLQKIIESLGTVGQS